MPDSQKAYLILENGEIFEGKPFGAEGETTGETVFTTGVTGYLETLTDSGHFGQIVTQTFPLIGNYGVIEEDLENAEPYVKGYIVKHWCQDPSNFRSEGNLDAFLKSKGIVGLYGVDTRRLTKILRENGVMNGRITRGKPDTLPDGVRLYRAENAAAACSVKTARVEQGAGEKKIAVIDYGLRRSLENEILSRAGEVTVFRYDTPAEDIIAYSPDGIVLSNGGGDPRADEYGVLVENAKKLCASGIPVFGVCFGHLLIALAHGFTVDKLKYGHRGANQPSRDVFSGRTYITAQNHGYAVNPVSIDTKTAAEWMVNVNDGTNEGVRYKDKPVRGVQFVPSGDTAFLYDNFFQMIEEI